MIFLHVNPFLLSNLHTVKPSTVTFVASLILEVISCKYDPGLSASMPRMYSSCKLSNFQLFGRRFPWRCCGDRLPVSLNCTKIRCAVPTAIYSLEAIFWYVNPMPTFCHTIIHPICDRIWENPPYGIFSEN